MSRKLHLLLDRYFGQLLPGSSVKSTRVLGEGCDAGDETRKGTGYGRPVRVDVTTSNGDNRRFVFHLAQPNEFGHDRRADRAADALLAYDTFPLIPNHAAVVDVGAVCGDAPRSLRDAGEFYIVTEFADGTPYADLLTAIGERGTLSDSDWEQCRRLADYLANLHATKIRRPAAYRRAIRDLVGHGEGVFGLVDSFPENVPGAPWSRIDAIERRCVEWRRRLRGREERLSRTHGDFHPFNILFRDDGSPALLDASRGCLGDPADDVTCLAVNYLFFAFDRPSASADAFLQLWDAFWDRYAQLTGDHDVTEVAPPFFAWRTLVLTNPVWYPNVTKATREALLALAEDSLDAGRLDTRAAADLLR